jgi:hypothetical protein
MDEGIFKLPPRSKEQEFRELLREFNPVKGQEV